MPDEQYYDMWQWKYIAEFLIILPISGGSQELRSVTSDVQAKTKVAHWPISCEYYIHIETGDL